MSLVITGVSRLSLDNKMIYIWLYELALNKYNLEGVK